jgi:hypothetical protein
MKDRLYIAWDFVMAPIIMGLLFIFCLIPQRRRRLP